MNKKRLKRIQRRCRFCEESNQAVLDVHRIHEGKDGGKYTGDNCVVVCANCHRKIHHTNEIKINGWFMSTKDLTSSLLGKWRRKIYLNIR